VRGRVIRVFIVAASPLARSGLQQLLASPEIEIVGRAVDFDSAAGLLSEPDAEPDVIIVDASRESGANAANLSAGSSEIGADIPIVVLENSENAAAGPDLLRQGARAILPAGISPAELIAALRAVTSGLIVLHPSTVAAIPHAAGNTSRSTEEWIESLTKREREVLQMLAAGLGNKEIAVKLNISEHTAKFHVGSILGKLGVSTRAEAVAMGIRRGLVLL
jgi:NarL family two-component system response regulator YdfI